MTGKTWTDAEETFFWQHVMRLCVHRVGADRARDQRSWKELARDMRHRLGADARRDYTATLLYEHFYQNVVTHRPSPRAKRFINEYFKRCDPTGALLDMTPAQRKAHMKLQTPPRRRTGHSSDSGVTLSSEGDPFAARPHRMERTATGHRAQPPRNYDSTASAEASSETLPHNSNVQQGRPSTSHTMAKRLSESMSFLREGKKPRLSELSNMPTREEFAYFERDTDNPKRARALSSKDNYVMKGRDLATGMAHHGDEDEKDTLFISEGPSSPAEDYSDSLPDKYQVAEEEAHRREANKALRTSEHSQGSVSDKRQLTEEELHKLEVNKALRLHEITAQHHGVKGPPGGSFERYRQEQHPSVQARYDRIRRQQQHDREREDDFVYEKSLEAEVYYQQKAQRARQQHARQYQMIPPPIFDHHGLEIQHRDPNDWRNWGFLTVDPRRGIQYEQSRHYGQPAQYGQSQQYQQPREYEQPRQDPRADEESMEMEEDH